MSMQALLNDLHLSPGGGRCWASEKNYPVWRDTPLGDSVDEQRAQTPSTSWFPQQCPASSRSRRPPPWRRGRTARRSRRRRRAPGRWRGCCRRPGLTCRSSTPSGTWRARSRAEQCIAPGARYEGTGSDQGLRHTQTHTDTHRLFYLPVKVNYISNDFLCHTSTNWPIHTSTH